MDQQPDQIRLIELAAEIVSAYVSNNSVQRSDLTRLIGDVHRSLAQAEARNSGEPAEAERPKLTPQEVRRSVMPDHLVSFEDGKRYKTLRRHLNLRGLTPQAYREKWGLAVDYPMVAPNYARQRSELARSLGLGQQRRSGLAKVSEADALRVELFTEKADSPQGEAAPAGAALAQAMTDGAVAPESERRGNRPKRARPPRARTRKGEAAPAGDT